MSDWYYYHENEKKGPVPADVIIDSVNQNGIPNNTKVWCEGMSTWVPYNQSPLIAQSKQRQEWPASVPPPIPLDEPLKPVMVSNELIWILAFLPLIMLVLNQFIKDPLIGFIMAVAANTALIVADSIRIQNAGQKSPNVFWLLIVPVYIFLRSKVLRQSYAPFWVWIVLFIITILSTPVYWQEIGALIPQKQVVDYHYTSPKSTLIEFDLNNQDPIASGNLVTAIKKTNITSQETMINTSFPVVPEDVTQNPLRYIGKIVRTKVQIAKIEQLENNEEMTGFWFSIIGYAKNSIDSKKVTTIEYILKGKATSLNIGQIVTCFGYFVGIGEGKNALNSNIKLIEIVGNKVAP